MWGVQAWTSRVLQHMEGSHWQVARESGLAVIAVLWSWSRWSWSGDGGGGRGGGSSTVVVVLVVVLCGGVGCGVAVVASEVRPS